MNLPSIIILIIVIGVLVWAFMTYRKREAIALAGKTVQSVNMVKAHAVKKALRITRLTKKT